MDRDDQELDGNTIKEKLKGRRVPCMVAFLHPFRIVEAKSETAWRATLDDVNSHSWDYIALHEMVGGVDVGLPAPYHMVVCRDGSVAIPPLPNLRSEQEAIDFFNKCFASLLLGGIYCEAIGVDGLDFGTIIDWKYLRVSTFAQSAANRFHYRIRYLRASPSEAIALKSPRVLSFKEFRLALAKGRSILESLPEVGGEILLRGVTAYARRDWAAALANLWISIEQLTSYIWKRDVLGPAKLDKITSSRLKQLSDYRTWTTAARHELLLQIGSLRREAYAALSTARKARNAFAHEGKNPDESAATSSVTAIRELLRISTKQEEIPFMALNLFNHSISNPFESKDPKSINFSDDDVWMSIPKLPGEDEIEKLEAALRIAEHRP